MPVAVAAAGADGNAVIAVYTIEHTRNFDPLRAAFTTLGEAATRTGDDYQRLITDLRAEFFPKRLPADRYERWI
ncbi:hypothetical protein GCM10011591_39050 [Nocardia camponoti]|uniref:Uncharacterized protein n=1 Tax=Nocardia camponoti TaxID=1616106 RepID=A0A917QR40_9NOCA|nr:hypothetical protein GCM10011591_39050 [Nocardia camponoti]